MHLVIVRCNRVTSEAEIHYRSLGVRKHVKGFLWGLATAGKCKLPSGTGLSHGGN